MDAAKRFERIFLATDGSEASKAAVDATIAIAKSPTVKVKLAHVWNLEIHHRHGQWDVEVRSLGRGDSRIGSRWPTPASATKCCAGWTARC